MSSKNQNSSAAQQRISAAVNKQIDTQINRLAKMIYQTQTNSAAALYAIPLFHIEMMKYFHKAIPHYFDPRMLNEFPKDLSKAYTMDVNGDAAIRALQNKSRKDVERRKKEITNEDIPAI